MIGWIKLHRSLKDWQWYDDHNTTRLLVHLLINVNYEDKKWKGINVSSGSIITSFENLSKDVGLSLQQTRTCLSRLVKCGEVTRQVTNRFQLITLVKWEELQDNNNQTTSKSTIKQQSSNNLSTTTKEVKEIKRTIEDRKADFKKSLSEFYYQNTEESNKFFDYWTEHGEKDKKMRFEKEKSFSLKSRWNRWLKNSKEWAKEKSPKKSKQPAYEIIQQVKNGTYGQ